MCSSPLWASTISCAMRVMARRTTSGVITWARGTKTPPRGGARDRSRSAKLVLPVREGLSDPLNGQDCTIAAARSKARIVPWTPGASFLAPASHGTSGSDLLGHRREEAVHEAGGLVGGVAGGQLDGLGQDGGRGDVRPLEELVDG